MHKNLAVLTIFLAILSNSKATRGQNITTAAPPGDAILAATDSSTSPKTEDRKDVSLEASAEAKRLYKEAVKYGRGGLFRQASELFQRAVELNPNYAEAHYALGNAYLDLGLWNEAIRSFENGMKLNPKDKNARARLDQAYVLAGRNTKPATNAEEKIDSAVPISTNAWVESRSRNVMPPSVTQETITQTTVAPTTIAPTTIAPTTVAPTTVAPSTVAPSTVAPSTVTPTTVARTTVAPTTVAPTTVAPTTVAPTTVAPTTVAPTTVAPTTVAPTTVAPTTVAPTTVAPTTVAPTTVAPTTVAPTTVAPTTVAPTTVAAPLSASTAALPDNSRSSSTTGNDLTRIYHIGIGDVLDVRLGNEPGTQSTLFTVTPSGLLEHPILAAPLKVLGLTVEETTARLEADLKRRAVNENPRVLVGVREYLSHAIIVSGLVKEPGTKLLRREAIPLYVVIADAQPAPEAGRATLNRHETGEALIVDLSKPTEMNLLVRSGDVITVQEAPKQFFYVGGEVKAPGEKQFRAGLTLTQAILTAGGLNREAKQAHIARASDNGFLASTRYRLKDINTGKLVDPLIQPGDRVTIEH
jgi:protein involved in polysaccharide export with SLBB domain